MKRIYPGIKRFLDFCLALIGLLVVSPVFLITAVLVLRKLGRPVFFYQERPGKDGRIFRMVKFRTMLNTTDESGKLLPSKQRHTEFGKYLRSTSIDELPELINVLKGEMSLVGPRPLLVEYLPRYSKDQMKRHEVKPGITGLAQINGRNAISWEDRFDYDIHYVENYNLLMDIKIMVITVFKVFRKENVNLNENVTMTKFMGTAGEKQNQDTVRF